MTEQAAEIYTLIDPRDGRVRYIGKANDSAKRLKTHLRDCRRRQTPLYCWIRKLLAEGMVPRVEVIQKTEDWRTAERELIASYRAQGHQLLNVAEGGDEPYCPRSVRAENGRKNAAAIHSDPKRKEMWRLKKRLSSVLNDKYMPEEYKERHRQRLRALAAWRPDLFGNWANV